MHKLPKSALNGIFRCETVWEGFSSKFSKNGINFIVRNHKEFILSVVLKEKHSLLKWQWTGQSRGSAVDEGCFQPRGQNGYGRGLCSAADIIRLIK